MRMYRMSKILRVSAWEPHHGQNNTIKRDAYPNQWMHHANCFFFQCLVYSQLLSLHTNQELNSNETRIEWKEWDESKVNNKIVMSRVRFFPPVKLKQSISGLTIVKWYLNCYMLLRCINAACVSLSHKQTINGAWSILIGYIIHAIDTFLYQHKLQLNEAVFCKYSI